MKKRNFILLNIEMTKRLFLASPKYFGINLASTLVHTLTFIVQTLFYRYIIDGIVYSNLSLKEAAFAFAIYFGMSFFSYMINAYVKTYFGNLEKVRICQYYKTWICGEISQKSIQTYNLPQYKDMIYNAVYGNGEYLFAFSEKLFGFFDSIMVFIMFFGIFSRLEPIIIVIVLLVTIKNMSILSKRNRIHLQLYQQNMFFERADINIRNMFYTKDYVDELRLFPVGELMINKFAQNKKKQWEMNKVCYAREAKLNIVDSFSEQLVKATVFLILVVCLVENEITVGDFNLVLGYFATSTSNLERIFNFFPNIYSDANYIKDILSVAEDNHFTYPQVRRVENKSCVCFNDVAFQYSQDGKAVKNINISIPLDKKIAIVGENGSGKSTFIKLLLGLYQPTEGHIAYYYPDVDAKSTMDLFGVLLQDFRLFPLSIAENITLENEGIKENVKRALHFSGLYAKVMTLEKGENTMLYGEFEEKGTYLSGGEEQKLAIARAYYADKPVLVLDEPSGNLDPFAENALIEKLNELSEHKAVILVSHNLLHTKNADLVIVFQKGEIVEYDSPANLIKKKGFYYKMCKEQGRE